jgi:hypothetical protein
MKGLNLHVGNRVFDEGARVLLEPDVYLRVGVELVLAKSSKELVQFIEALQSDPAMYELGIGVDDLEFVVYLTSPFLKIVDIVLRVPLRNLIELGPSVVVSGDPRHDALQSPNAGCEVIAMICLGVSKPKAALKPWRRGTWLSVTTFAIGTERSLSSFSPRPLSPAKKTELRLPQSTARYIRIVSSPLDVATTEEDVEMWIDSGLLARMSSMPKSKGSMALQRQLFVDAVSAIVSAAHRSDYDNDMPELATVIWPDIEKSLLGRVIAALAPGDRDEVKRDSIRADYLELMKRDPSCFIAYAEDHCGIGASFTELMEI